jgi:DNA-binding NtrC family response regulator
MTAPDKVLLVDDEVDFAETLAERLRARGLHVEVATSGEKAILRARTMSFDAVVLDLAMPGMDGIETLKMLRDNDPDIQVMLLTGQATIKAAVEASRLGAVDVLEKPTDIATLMEKIREARAKHLGAKKQRSQERVDDILRKRGW